MKMLKYVLKIVQLRYEFCSTHTQTKALNLDLMTIKSNDANCFLINKLPLHPPFLLSYEPYLYHSWNDLHTLHLDLSIKTRLQDK